MDIKVYFQYTNEVISFERKNIKIIAFIFYFFVVLVQLASNSDMLTGILVMSFISLVYMAVFINTVRIQRKRKQYIKDGTRYSGRIVAFCGKNTAYNYEENHTTSKYWLIVEYQDNMGEIRQVKTTYVNGNPYSYLKSLNVSVYVLGNGDAYVTDFERIDKMSEGVVHRMNPEDTKVHWER